jgi:hypothetical protein
MRERCEARGGAACEPLELRFNGVLENVAGARGGDPAVGAVLGGVALKEQPDLVCGARSGDASRPEVSGKKR